MTDPVGYIRKSPHGKALKLSLSVESVEGCTTRDASNGVEFYDFYLSTHDTVAILDDKRDVTFIVTLDPDENETETFIRARNNTELSGA